ncbi:MAG: hypothetical protein GX284_07575 [Clostridiales bacterium]|nr:hypothetical protein [Clostridiales bacterium]
MSPRTGRQTDNPRKERLGIRVTEEELRKLQVCCQKTGKSKTEVISEGIKMVYERVSNKK